MNRYDPYEWSRIEHAAYQAHEVHRSGNVPREITERNLRTAGTPEKDIRSIMQSVLDKNKK